MSAWAVTYSDEDFVNLGDGPVQLGFQRVPGYRAPDWPGGVRQAHLDFAVADPGRAAKELLAIGATRPAFQPGAGKGAGKWVVLADPEGNVFCLTTAD